MDLARVTEGRGLSPQQAAFVERVLAGDDPESAKSAAGYSDTTRSSEILASESVQTALRAGRRAVIAGELGTLAVNAIRDLLKEGTAAATRFAAARYVLDQADQQDRDGEKPMSEMTPTELAAFIDKLEKRMEAAKIVTVTPNDAP